MEAVPIVGGLVGNSMNNSAASSAANAQTQAAEAANRTNWNMFNADVQLNDWQRMGGGSAYNEYLQMMGLAPVNITPASDILGQYNSQGGRSGGEAMLHDGIPGNYAAYQNGSGPTIGTTPTVGTGPTVGGAGYTPQQVSDKLMSKPGYQFALNEGTRGVQASAAARGGLNSGATLKALTRFGQDYASNQYDKELNRLSALFGGAQVASNNLGNAATQFGQSAGNNAINAGNARANMYTQRGQNNSDTLNGIGGYGASRGWWG